MTCDQKRLLVRIANRISKVKLGKNLQSCQVPFFYDIKNQICDLVRDFFVIKVCLSLVKFWIALIFLIEPDG